MSTSALQQLQSLITIFEKETEYLPQWAKDCGSEYPLQSIINIRKLISDPLENNPPIQQVIDSGVIPQIIKLLTQNNYNFDMFISGYTRQFNFEYIIHSDIINYIRDICKLYCIDDKLQSEGRWILANICCLADDQTQYIVNQGAIPILIEGLKSTGSIDTKSTSIAALANITGTSEFINIVLEHDILHLVMNIVKNTNLKTQNKTEIELLQDISRFLYNLSGDKLAEWKYVKLLVSILTVLFRANDVETVHLALGGVSKLLSDENPSVRRHIDAVLNCGYLSQIVKLLGHKLERIRRAALCLCGDISYMDDSNGEQLIGFGLLSALNNLLSDTDLIKEECCWLISNICVTKEQVECVIAGDIFPKIINILKNDQYSVAKEALWVVNNAAKNGCDMQYLIAVCLIDEDVISALFGWFTKTRTTSKKWEVALEAIRFVLNAAKIVKSSNSNDTEYKYYVEKCNRMYDLNEIFCEQTMGYDASEIWNKIESIIGTHCEEINPIIIGRQHKSILINDMIENLEKQMKGLKYLKDVGWTDIKPNTTYYLYI